MTARERRVRRRLAYHLRKAMREVAGKPMQWGVDDCALFHANVQFAVTGFDPCAEFRGRYKTRRGAHRVLGHGGLPAAMRRFARKHRWKAINPSAARVGDIGLIPVGNATAFVRCLHRGEWIGRNVAGWSMVATKSVRLAWAVY